MVFQLISCRASWQVGDPQAAQWDQKCDNRFQFPLGNVTRLPASCVISRQLVTQSIIEISRAVRSMEELRDKKGTESSENEFAADLSELGEDQDC